jgi:hypothetical protein
MIVASHCMGRLVRHTREAAAVAGLVLSLVVSAFAQAPAPGQQRLQPPRVAAQPPAPSQPSAALPAPVDGKVSYRGFTVDVRTIAGTPNYDAVMALVAHQMDIVADCGAKPEIIRFFQSQVIVLAPPTAQGPGHFNANQPGITISNAVLEPQKPILLHELLHAYHFRVLPGAFRNADILTYYNRARDGRRYPADAYVLKNVQEFFAVTASLYLWGHVDRPPSTREKLKAAQPAYYAWLGQLFGVAK